MCADGYSLHHIWLQAWCGALKSDTAFANWKNDQQSLNELARRGAKLPQASSNASSQAQLITVYDGSLRLGLLPTSLWPSGHVFFIQRQVNH